MRHFSGFIFQLFEKLSKINCKCHFSTVHHILCFGTGLQVDSTDPQQTPIDLFPNLVEYFYSFSLAKQPFKGGSIDKIRVRPMKEVIEEASDLQQKMQKI